MADVKISGLPPGANVATPDFYPAVKGGVTVRITHAQLMTLIETALTKLLLSGGGISLNANGSAALGNGSVLVGIGGDLQVGAGAAVIQPDGSATFGTGALSIATDGSISIPLKWQLAADGSATFAGALVAIDSLGVIAQPGGNWAIQQDGSAQFSGGLVQIEPDGDILIVDKTKGVILTAPDNSLWRLQVSNTGVLTTVAA